MLTSFCLLCLATFTAGYLLSLVLFWRKKWKFKGSQIQVKVHFWIPIFLAVILAAQGYKTINLTLLGMLIALVIYEFTAARVLRRRLLPSLAYLLLIITGVFALAAIACDSTTLFVATWYVSVISDVGAYFMGNFFGRHHLPKIINNRKSWEGALGQLLGALTGSLLFSQLVQPLPAWMWLVVGLGSLVGDIVNSYIKRLNGMRDWSNRIPGHGGYIDRLSSLSFASIVVFILFV